MSSSARRAAETTWKARPAFMREAIGRAEDGQRNRTRARPSRKRRAIEPAIQDRRDRCRSEFTTK